MPSAGAAGVAECGGAAGLPVAVHANGVQPGDGRACRRADGPKAAAVPVIVTAFTSVFSLLLGYSQMHRLPPRSPVDFCRCLAAPSRRGIFRKMGTLLALAGVAYVVQQLFRWPGDVVAALVVIGILLQFPLQHVGVMVLRRTQPDLPRPFRIGLYHFASRGGVAGVLVHRGVSSRALVIAKWRWRGVVLIAAGVAGLRGLVTVGRAGC